MGICQLSWTWRIGSRGHEIKTRSEPATGDHPSRGDTRSDQSGLTYRRGDEIREQWMRVERLRFQLGMILHADIPGMARQFDDFRQHPIRRHAAETQSRRLQFLTIIDVD